MSTKWANILHWNGWLKMCECVWKYCSIELIPVWVVTHHYFAYGVHCLVNVGRSLFLRVQKTKVLNALPQNRIAKLNSIIFYLLNGERRNWVEWKEKEFGEKQNKNIIFRGCKWFRLSNAADVMCPMHTNFSVSTVHYSKICSPLVER